MIQHIYKQATYGNNQRDIELVLENIVCLELLRLGYKVTIEKMERKRLILFATKTASAFMSKYATICPLKRPKNVNLVHMKI